MKNYVTLPGTTGDGAFISAKHDDVTALCSSAPSPIPTSSVDILIERSRARAAMRLWEDALEDADEVPYGSPLISMLITTS